MVLDTITTTITPDQAGIMKEYIDTLDTGIIITDGTTIMTTNHYIITSIGIPRAPETGIKLIFIADTNTPPKTIPNESTSN
jgi:5,10-methenyltetrahydromethanopterin hydrogenase